MEKREIYILQKQQTKNFIFPVVIASCLRTETFLIEYHKVDQSLNLLSGMKYIIMIQIVSRKQEKTQHYKLHFFFWNYMVLFP